MEEKKDICAAIIADADKYAAEATKSAEEYAKTRAAETEKEVSAYAVTQAELAEKGAADIAAKNAAAERMERKKILLAAKAELIDEVYKKLEARLDGMSEADLAVFSEKLIEKYAAKGDEIIVSENSKVKAEKFTEMNAVKNLGLKVSGGGKFSGGFIIRSAAFDTDLSFAAIVRSVREDTEAEVSAKLFD